MTVAVLREVWRVAEARTPRPHDPWESPLSLLAPAVPAQPAVLVRGRVSRDRRPLVRRLLVLAIVVLLLPVPWQHKSDSGLGLAWTMDHRLRIDGRPVDPPGRWSWLTVGRPPVVGEHVWHGLAGVMVDDPSAPVASDLRAGPPAARPDHAEPIAAAVGIQYAEGRAGSDPLVPVDAALGGDRPPYSWVRSLSVGSSHGLMVGLVAYVTRSGEDLAYGRHIAGTGTLEVDGTVGRIGGLPAKAVGARRAGVDVLLVPADQREELDGVDLGSMVVLAVRDLGDAIEQLRVVTDGP